jgi:hypothetical protein
MYDLQREGEDFSPALSSSEREMGQTILTNLSLFTYSTRNKTEAEDSLYKVSES